ncbi:MAG: 30S ribosomal protein S16 [Sandaracinaceae bacterium]|nr:30S ribosomal protein S16 [Sandaracinaceae bacterium]MCC6875215.1 30S ribosomal protein S16 [Sandaracinaceae bacterium]
MVKIRLARYGAKKRPYYHVVVSDIDACRDGKFLEQVGTYHPTTDGLRVDFDRVDYWLGVGAQPTLRVRHLLNTARRAAAAAAPPA